MNIIQQYVKNGIKILGGIGAIGSGLTTLILIIYFIINGFKPLGFSLFETLGFLLLVGFLPLIILLICWLLLISVYIQIKKYLKKGENEEKQELNELINRTELTVPSARWYYKELHLSQNFLLSLPNFITEKKEIKLCKSYGKRHRKNITYYRVKVYLKNGKEKVLEYPNKRNIDAILNWWKLNE